MKILLTGFEPFGGENINPSWEAVKAAKAPEGVQLKKVCLPVTFAGAQAVLREQIGKEQPDIVLSVGQAGGRSGISLERIGVNLMDARIPDNDGCQPEDSPLVPDGETAYLSTLPLRDLLKALEEAGIPASISNTAGLYVCNTVLYTALREAALHCPGMRAGFIHVPYLPEQAAGRNLPSLSLEEDVRALEIVLERLV